MRKLFSFCVVMLICMALVLPVFATEEGFVPSITYKPDPEIVSVVSADGAEHIGVIRNAQGEIVDYVDHGCLRITPIAHVWDETKDVPAEIEELLLFVYDGLKDGSMEIPYEKHAADLNAKNMIVRDLLDIRWNCQEHPIMLEPEGVTLELTFDLGIVPDAQIFIQTYDETTKEWGPIVEVVNNGDGTVTCVFEHLCVVEFSMPVVAAAAPVEEAKDTNVTPYVIAAAGAGAAGVGVYFGKKKKSAV